MIEWRKEAIFGINLYFCTLYHQVETSMKKKYLLLLFLICLPGLSKNLHAQTLAQAREMYAKGDYQQAKPTFERLVKSAPSNGNYNLWYGVCCLETGDYEQAVPYLEKAVKRRVPSGQYHLARAYDKTYRFEEAEEVCNAYLKDLTRRRRDTGEADSLAECIRTHLRMMKGVERVCVIDSFVTSKTHFLDAYRIGAESGSLSLYEEHFEDNGKSGGTVYETELGNKLYYSELQPDSTLALLTSAKLLDGWSQGTLLPESINQGVNANYPFVMADGVTLYYAADGKESMGGYDIFVTRYNTNTNNFLTPENVGMPFNSPYNDYMYVVDEYNNLGWFASDRYQPADSVCIYVFIPNPSKQVYDYELMDKEQLRRLASLRSIGQTWSDAAMAQDARQRLMQAMQREPKKQQAYDFTFIINDERTYHQLADFQSARAKELFSQYRQLEQGYRKQQEALTNARTKYMQASDSNKAQLAPAILDLEKRVRQLHDEVEEAAKQVRNAEIQTHQ